MNIGTQNITRDQMPSAQQANYPGRRFLQMQELLNNRINGAQPVEAQANAVGMGAPVQQQSVWK
jgi:hypothetical protein